MMTESKNLGGENQSPIDVGAADAEQLLYAKILSLGMYLGLGTLLVTYLLYAAGILEPAIPIEELPRLWSMSVHDYLEAVNHEYLHRDAVVVGWGWLGLLRYGDYLNFIGIAGLAGVTIICYMGILPRLLQKKDWIIGSIVILEILVLTLAASGIVSVGH